MRILVVDDEDNLRRVMRLTLEASGYEVMEAPDGEAALDAFGDGAGFDIVLLDHKMPGMDGLEALRRMRLRRADARVVVVTAYASIELAVEAMKLGATDFVRKPMTPETLRHAVAAVLAKGEGAAASRRQDAEPLPREVWTTNGFFVRPAVRPITPASGAEHHFLVSRGGDPGGVDVAVSIDPKAMARVARTSGRNLAFAGTFWRQYAERALLEYLWREAAIPEEGRLEISRVPGSTIDAAMTWAGD